MKQNQIKYNRKIIKNRKKSDPKESKVKKAEKQFQLHPQYGKIPLIPKPFTKFDGTSDVWYDYDPDYIPPMPVGAIRGDVRKQEFCQWCHCPKYFYIDIVQKCVQCGNHFTFSASEQKFWYESLKFHFDSIAIRCKECRRKKRTDKSLFTLLGEILNKIKLDPKDPTLLVSLAQVTISMIERTGQGNIDRAIAATRKALELSPNYAQAVYWEARCQEIAQRGNKARELYLQFLDLPNSLQFKTLCEEAKKHLTYL